MRNDRKQEIIENLKGILAEFVPSEEEPEPTMFWLISQYNSRYDNPELIGGNWVLENTDIRLPI